MAIHSTRVETVLYVGVPLYTFTHLQEFFGDFSSNLDYERARFEAACGEIPYDEIFEDILENANSLGIQSIVVFELDQRD
jgi:hypothetical protein